MDPVDVSVVLPYDGSSLLEGTRFIWHPGDEEKPPFHSSPYVIDLYHVL
jgi:hypothetical protein